MISWKDTRKSAERFERRNLVLAVVTAAFCTIGILVFSYSFYVTSRTTITQTTEELHGSTLEALTNLAKVFVTSFDWPQVDGLVETTMHRADIDAFWIEDELSGKIFGEPFSSPLSKDQEKHQDNLRLGDKQIGKVNVIFNTQARNTGIAKIRNFVAATAVGLVAFVSAIVFGLVKLAHQAQQNDANRKANERLEARVSERTEELEAMTQIAQDASMSKSRFLATMSHELRTPMNGIIGMTEIIETGDLKDDVRRQLETVRLSANSLLGIINDILDFSAIEAGRLNIGTAAVDIEAEINSVCSLLGQVAQQRNVRLYAYVDPIIPHNLLGDPLRIRQIVTNIVGNALKFSSRKDRTGLVEISVSQTEYSDTHVQLEIRVKDNGIGIKEEDQKRLFQPFEQVKNSLGTSIGGTGLGLAISRELAAAMDGDIELSSEYGSGSVFVFRLPLEIDQSVDAREPLLEGVSIIYAPRENERNGHFIDYLKKDGAELISDDSELTFAGKKVGLLLPSTSSDYSTTLQDLRKKHPELPCLIVGDYLDNPPSDVDVNAEWIAGNFLTKTKLAKQIQRLLNSQAEDPFAALPQKMGRTQQFSDIKPILVAEDNLVNQTVIRNQLNLLGVEAEIVSDGIEALEKWKTGDYELLLTDIQMPRMTGLELAQEIRKIENLRGTSRLAILALSADVQKEQIAAALQSGIDGYITKPISLDKLRESLSDFLG